jgi:stress-induced morphogen
MPLRRNHSLHFSNIGLVGSGNPRFAFVSELRRQSQIPVVESQNHPSSAVVDGTPGLVFANLVQNDKENMQVAQGIDHVSVFVVSDKFVGQRATQRQQMVYKALWEELQGPVHAVDSVIFKTLEEA